MPAAAQVPGLASAPAAAPETPEPARLNDDQRRLIIRTLEDPKAREDFLKKVKAFDTAAVEQQEKERAASPSLQALGAVNKAFESATSNFAVMMRGFANIPQIINDFSQQFRDEPARVRMLGFCLRTALALAAGFAVYFLLYLILGRPRRRLENSQAESLVSKLGIFFIYHLFTLLPPLGFIAASMVTAGTFEMEPSGRQALAAILSAFIVQQIVVWLIRMLFAASTPHLRFLPIKDESAAYLSVWSTRFAGVMIFGFFLARAASALGVAPSILHAFIACVGFVITLMAIILVLQNRQAVAEWIRGASKDKEGEEKKETEFLASTRARLAELWHILAIAYLSLGFIIAALDLERGFQTLAKATVVTIVTLAAIHLLLSGVRRLVAQGFALPKEFKREFPGLEERTNSYLPVFQRIIQTLAWLLGGVIILSAWGFDVVVWFATEPGKAMLSSAVAIGLTLLAAVILWEIINNLIEHTLERRDAHGHRVVRSARMRTLLPLLRISLRILLIVMAVLIVLSRMGLDITPLLAGAGIVGLAVGFGAQTLVKDFITGLFILMEDTISVGDIVETGNHSGVVEAMTIRTLRLRDINGHVHSLPFSEVTSVINKTKHFAYVVIDIGVGYDANVEKIMEIMQETAEKLRQDPASKNTIYAPMEMMGLEQYAASSIIVRGRIKVHPLEQWNLRRKYLLLLKQALSRAGIMIPIGVIAQTRMGPQEAEMPPAPPTEPAVPREAKK